MNRHERQRRLNTQLSVLPPFTPQNDYDIYHIHEKTSSLVLHDLIDMARKTTQCSIDTENDYRTHRPALIQIECIRPRSMVLLVQVCHLPRPSSALFWLIQSLLKVILRPSNTILAWGDATGELSTFVPYGLFSAAMVAQQYLIDVRDRFKRSYNRRYPHTCGLPFKEDHPSCTCPHRPVKNNNDRWSLQKAVASTFRQFLDKTCTQSDWSRRLDQSHGRSAAMIAYAANDCLAVTHLFAVLETEWTK